MDEIDRQQRIVTMVDALAQEAMELPGRERVAFIRRRIEEVGANDSDRLAAICSTCDERQTPRDLKEIARTKRLALEHQEFLERKRDKVPGRRAPSRTQFNRLERCLAGYTGAASNTTAKPSKGEGEET